MGAARAVVESIVAVDPGRQKCGLAVLSTDGRVLDRRVIAREELLAVLEEWWKRYAPSALVVGDRTGSVQFVAEINASGLVSEDDIHLVDEHLSTLEARQRYFVDHPPTGWKRLVPLTMQVPPEPYDDYVAVILAERFLAARGQESP